MTRTSAARLALFACLTSATVLSPPGTAQDLSLTGVVTDEADAPVQRARVVIAPIDLAVAPPARGKRSRYARAQRAHAATLRPSVTATDRDGRWVVNLQPEQAALLTAAEVAYELRIEADGFVTWRRCLPSQRRELRRLRARLERETETPPLRVRLGADVPRPVRGALLVERSFRVRDNRSIWLRDVVPFAADGHAAFRAGPRVSGEPEATTLTARADAYRITAFVADRAAASRLLEPGDHTLELEPAAWRPRRVLGERARPARGPIRATYAIAGEELTVELPSAEVPLLGDEPPIRVETADGPAELDTWDPDVPLFLAREDDAERTPGADATPAPSSLVVRVRAVDDQERPLFGAGVWLGDRTMRALARAGIEDGVGFAMTDGDGFAELRGVPAGTHSVLVHHALGGFVELACDAGADPEAVPCKTRRPMLGTPGPVGPRCATVLIEFDEADSDTPTEIGIVTPSGRVVRRRLEQTPRIVRVEGVVVGPTTLWSRTGEAAPRVFAEVLATLDDEARVRPDTAPTRTVTLDVRTAAGEPADTTGATLTLPTQMPGRSGAPMTNLIDAKPGEAPGTLVVRGHVAGPLWLRLTTTDGAHAEFALPATPAGDAEPVPVRLGAPPPPPETKDGDATPAGTKPGPKRGKG